MKYVCNLCGWVYDEEEAGVKWEDLPDDFTCELCASQLRLRISFTEGDRTIGPLLFYALSAKKGVIKVGLLSHRFIVF